MYQFVEDLQESQYKNFIKTQKLNQKRETSQECLYFGVAKDRKLVACIKVFTQVENRKKIFSIPLGVQTIIEEIELYLFLKKYLVITAKKYGVQKIKIYSKENPYLLQIGFVKGKKKCESYLPLKKEKTIKIPSYLQIVELNSERKRSKLKELKVKNKDLFLFNNVSFFAMQLDLYTYLDTLTDPEKRKIVKNTIAELGEVQILESISIEYLNDSEVLYIDKDNYSSILQEERKGIFFPKLKEELQKKGINKLFLPSQDNTPSLEQEFIIEYEYSINSIINLIQKRG